MNALSSSFKQLLTSNYIIKQKIGIKGILGKPKSETQREGITSLAIELPNSNVINKRNNVHFNSYMENR